MLKRLLNFVQRGLDGELLVQSQDKRDYAQIDLLAQFVEPQPTHSALEQQQWSRVLPQDYAATIGALQSQGWLAAYAEGYQVTDAGMVFVRGYQERLARERVAIIPQVRAALEARDTGEALQIRRAYEARQPLDTAAWTGPEPQLSHSALTRRIFFLDDAVWLPNVSPETATWLKLYAAEQHLWGTYWWLKDEEIPDHVRTDLATPTLSAAEVVYARAYQLALYVDNQETWQRCSGGDHVRRIALAAPRDHEDVCTVCRAMIGEQFLVARVPDLPLRDCTCLRGCRLRYEPVLEMYDDL